MDTFSLAQWLIILSAWLSAMVTVGVAVEYIVPWVRRQIVDWQDCRRVLRASGLPRPLFQVRQRPPVFFQGIAHLLNPPKE